ncbi:MAG: hypothetical protein IJR63_01205 [Synergistaceae bacterium]|nr:hypothetical protein [Synergistaceae bacterium]
MFGKTKVFQLYSASITPETVCRAIMGFLEDSKGLEVSAKRSASVDQAQLTSSVKHTFKESLGLDLGVSVEISLMNDNSLKVSVDTGDTSAHDMTVTDTAMTENPAVMLLGLGGRVFGIRKMRGLADEIFAFTQSFIASNMPSW